MLPILHVEQEISWCLCTLLWCSIISFGNYAISDEYTPGPCILQFLERGKSCIKWISHKVNIHLLWIYSTSVTYYSPSVAFYSKGIIVKPFFLNWTDANPYQISKPNNCGSLKQGLLPPCLKSQVLTHQLFCNTSRLYAHPKWQFFN